MQFKNHLLMKLYYGTKNVGWQLKYFENYLFPYLMCILHLTWYPNLIFIMHVVMNDQILCFLERLLILSVWLKSCLFNMLLSFWHVTQLYLTLHLDIDQWKCSWQQAWLQVVMKKPKSVRYGLFTKDACFWLFTFTGRFTTTCAISAYHHERCEF
jgi:hypothetical protein